MRNCFDSFELGTRVMHRLHNKPTTANPTSTNPASGEAAPNRFEINPAATIPRMTAMLVPIPITPLPQASFSVGNNSGKLPYLAGPKNALCVLIKKITPTMKVTLPCITANVARIMISTSDTFVPTATIFFE